MADRKSIGTAGPEYVAFIGLVAVLILTALLGPADAQTRPVKAKPRVCFPAKRWDAAPGKRPCARITRVYEDGSIELAVSDADGTVRWRAQLGARDR